MRIDLRMNERRYIVPATLEDAEKLKRVRAGDLMPVTIRQARNGDHHRKFMALVAFVADNHPDYNAVDDVLRILKYRTHHFDETVTRGGRIVYEMKSIAWDAMDEGDFVIWSAKARAVIFDELWPQMPRELIEREMAEWERWS